jgi:hypothetical protein
LRRSLAGSNPKRLVAVSRTLERILARTERVFSLALGQAHAAGGDYEPANKALDEALNIASHVCDPKLVARLHGARSIVNYHFFRLSEAPPRTG